MGPVGVFFLIFLIERSDSLEAETVSNCAFSFLQEREVINNITNNTIELNFLIEKIYKN